MNFKLNPLTGNLDLVGGSSGPAPSANPIIGIDNVGGPSVTLVLNSYQQMIAVNYFIINGTLNLQGTFIIL